MVLDRLELWRPQLSPKGSRSTSGQSTFSPKLNIWGWGLRGAVRRDGCSPKCIPPPLKQGAEAPPMPFSEKQAMGRCGTLARVRKPKNQEIRGLSSAPPPGSKVGRRRGDNWRSAFFKKDSVNGTTFFL